MAWTTPKTNWTSADGISYVDLNEIGNNLAFIGTNPSGTILQLAPTSTKVTTDAIFEITNGYTDLTIKTGVVNSVHYNNGFGTPVDLITTYNTLSGNAIFWGGGSGAGFAATNQKFYTAANNSTVTGNLVMELAADRSVSFPGTVGTIEIEGSGTNIKYSKAGANFVQMTDVTGYYDILTGGAVSGSHAVRFTAANHALFNTSSDTGETLHIGAGGFRSTGTSKTFLIKATGFLDNTQLTATENTDQETGLFAITTGTGDLQSERLIFGIEDGLGAFINATKPGTAPRRLTLNPQGGEVLLDGSLSLTGTPTVSSLSYNGTGIIVARGIYQLAGGVGSSDLRVEQKTGAAWNVLIDVNSSYGGFFVSDGINTRIRSIDSSSGTIAVLKF